MTPSAARKISRPRAPKPRSNLIESRRAHVSEKSKLFTEFLRLFRACLVSQITAASGRDEPDRRTVRGAGLGSWAHRTAPTGDALIVPRWLGSYPEKLEVEVDGQLPRS